MKSYKPGNSKAYKKAFDSVSKVADRGNGSYGIYDSYENQKYRGTRSACRKTRNKLILKRYMENCGYMYEGSRSKLVTRGSLVETIKLWDRWMRSYWIGRMNSKLDSVSMEYDDEYRRGE